MRLTVVALGTDGKKIEPEQRTDTLAANRWPTTDSSVDGFVGRPMGASPPEVCCRASAPHVSSRGFCAPPDLSKQST